jgi:hypothetical protein
MSRLQARTSGIVRMGDGEVLHDCNAGAIRVVCSKKSNHSETEKVLNNSRVAPSYALEIICSISGNAEWISPARFFLNLMFSLNMQHFNMKLSIYKELIYTVFQAVIVTPDQVSMHTYCPI